MADSAAAFTTFGALLRYLRRRARLTQIDLAIATGYSTGQISRLEQNQRLPNADVVHALFVPALDLETEPALVARLHELARAARDGHGSDGVKVDAGRSELVAPDTVGPGSRMAAEAAPRALEPLLLTKVYLPRQRPNLVVRQRLRTRLQTALHVPLTLVSAPAGFGKTTLVSQWLTELSIEKVELRNASQFSTLNAQFGVAWLALDEGDNDPLTLLRYLITALQTVHASVGTTALTLLQAPQPPRVDLVMHTLLNDLAAAPHETVLVLEDYHRLTAPAIHTVLTQLLEYVPPTLHLVLTTRADPPLPLARLRARGQLLEIRAADLRFTTDEATQFLCDIMGVALSDDEIAALETRTEGWIAGLQLAALVMRDRGDVSAFIATFAGSNRFVVDYLAAEVLELQAPHVQAFLLETSILDRLCGPLCDAVVGVEQATAGPQGAYTQALLDELERANLFVVPLDDERRWYRYHHLFGDVLRERLVRGASADAVAQLHRRASAWYAQHGFIEEAIDHAVAAGDWAAAARLLAEHGSGFVISGRVHRALAWIEALPDVELHAWPEVEVICAGGLMLDNQLQAATVWLDRAAHDLTPDRPPADLGALSGAIAMLRGNIRYLYGDFGAVFALLRQALELLPEDTTQVRLAAHFIAILRTSAQVLLATAYKITGDVTPPIEAQAVAAVEPARATGNFIATFNSLTYLARLQHLQGRLRTAAASYGAAVAGLTDPGVLALMGASASYFFGLGDIEREWNQLDAAEHLIEQGMVIVDAQVPVDADVVWQGYLARTRVYQARGEAAMAAATLDAFGERARRAGYADTLLLHAAAARARLALGDGDRREALAWAATQVRAADDAVSYEDEFPDVTLARVRIAHGQAEAVLPLLERWTANAQANARMHSVIELLALQAVAYASLHQQRAHAALYEALSLAEPHGYVRVFVDEGAPMLRLLQAAAADGILPAYVATLIAAFGERQALSGAGSVSPTVRHVPDSTALAQRLEPLSEREREVLRLMADGLDNREIAARLVVGVSTVKKHINSIFGKLAVHSRTEALARARELDIT